MSSHGEDQQALGSILTLIIVGGAVILALSTFDVEIGIEKEQEKVFQAKTYPENFAPNYPFEGDKE